MYRRLLYITLVALLLVATACGDKKKQQAEVQTKSTNPMVEQLDETEDEAFLGILTSFSDDSLYVKTKKGYHKEVYSYAEAMGDGNLYGSLKRGDTYSILPKGKRATIIVNVTELSGKWEYDAQQHRGFSFNEGGGMSSINNETLCFREWKLLNGKFYIYTVGQQDVADDRHQYDVAEAYIEKLDANELVLQYNGQQYRCKRPSRKPVMLKPRV